MSKINSAYEFGININKSNCIARILTTNNGHNIPTETEVQRNGDNLFFHGLANNSYSFVAEIVEIYGINTN